MTRSNTILETRGLTKRFELCTAVSEVSLSFSEGEIHAVLGENGAGKSTLMKLLFGLLEPTSGEIHLRGTAVHWRSSMEAIRSGLGMVQQHFALIDTLSVIDNIMLGSEVCSDSLGHLNRKEAIRKIENLLPTTSLTLPWETLVSELTVGQKQRLEILKLLFRNAEILFLDEPTAVLTPQETTDLFHVLKKLKASGRTIVLITHKMSEVFEVCDTYTVLRQGQLITRGRINDAHVDQIVEAMIGRRLEAFTEQRSKSLETLALDCRDLREAESSRGSLNGISMHVANGEIVGIAGVEGSGQSHFVDALMGLREFSGEVRMMGDSMMPLQTEKVRNLAVGLVPEDRHHQGLWMNESCFSNMIIGLENKFVRHEIFDQAKIKSETAVWAKTFDVRAASLESQVSSLSGGNQQKVIFAREVNGRNPKLLICHQPTRGVDLGAIDLIHRKILDLRNNGVGVLVLSSELEELTKLCDRIYVFFEGRTTMTWERNEFDRLKIGAAMTGANHVS